MARIQHSTMSGLDVHGPWHYEQETDPGAVGGGKWWLKKSTFQIFRRNDTNTGWDTYFQGGGTSTQSANRIFAGPASGAAAAPTFRVAVPADVPTMVASGGSHAAGLVPDPGVTTGTVKFLREDATFALAALPYINLQDQKTQNTAGGTFTSGAWRTRDLNTIVTDTSSLTTLVANQFTLPAGTYRTRTVMPACRVDSFKCRLQNITDATTVALKSTNGYSSSVANQAWTECAVTGTFVIASTKTFEVQGICGTTNATNGFGLPGNLDTEVYTLAEFWKLA